jgi:hypothetical protein
VAKAAPWPLYPQERDPAPIAQEAEWAAKLVWMGAESLTLTGLRSPDHPAYNKLLYYALPDHAQGRKHHKVNKCIYICDKLLSDPENCKVTVNTNNICTTNTNNVCTTNTNNMCTTNTNNMCTMNTNNMCTMNTNNICTTNTNNMCTTNTNNICTINTNNICTTNTNNICTMNTNNMCTTNTNNICSPFQYASMFLLLLIYMLTLSM